jgi:HEAT repeat protein
VRVETRKRKRRLLVSVIVAVLAFASWLILSRSTEPVHDGRRLSQWLSSYSMYVPQSDEVRPAAHAAIRAIGMDGIPFLLEWIADPPQDSFVREKINEALAHRPEMIRRRVPDGVWDWATQRSKGRVFESVAEAFSALGPEAVTAIPRLRELRDTHPDPRVRWKATLALAGLSTEEIHPVVEVIDRGYPGNGLANDSSMNIYLKWSEAQSAFLDYPTLQTNIAPAVPALIKCLREEKVSVFTTLAISAVDYGQSHIILPALTNTLADPDSRMRNLAAKAIEDITGRLKDRE